MDIARRENLYTISRPIDCTTHDIHCATHEANKSLHAPCDLFELTRLNQTVAFATATATASKR